MPYDTSYSHERKILLVTLRNFIINIMDRYGLRYNEHDQTFTKHDKEGTTILSVKLSEIMKGL